MSSRSVKFEAANALFRGAKTEYYRAMAGFMSGMEFTTGIAQVVVIAVGGLLIMQGELDYVDLITFSLYITTFVSPIRRLTQFSEMYMQGMAGFTRFLEVMNTEPAVTDAPDARELGEVHGEVEYRDVSFFYHADLPVLSHVSVRLEAGKSLALVGPSGGGKTTAASLIPRFWDVSDGAVEVGGVDVRDTDPHVLMDQVAFVFQNNRLFKSSILENVRAARPEATREEVRQALSAAQCDDILEKLPQGMDTVIGTEGTYLSGGEQQRVALARAILKDAPIVVLDEATAFADPENEAMIQKAFAALTKDRTVIMIAHRLSTVVGADRIIVLDSGRVAEEGTHTQLLEKNGLYARMWAEYNQAVKWRISAAEEVQ